METVQTQPGVLGAPRGRPRIASLGTVASLAASTGEPPRRRFAPRFVEQPPNRTQAHMAAPATAPAAPAPPSPPPSRLEQLGRMSAGIAHDFNNVLSVILVCASELADTVADPTGRARAEEIREAASRGAEMTRRLLSEEAAAPEPVRLAGAVEGALPLLQRTLGGGVRLLTDVPSDLPPVRLAPGELGRILVNLGANARDAMPTGGTVAVHSRAISIPGGDARLGVGRHIRLSVSDGGSGMSPDVARRAAIPFFTTKTDAAGSGLGLATVAEIARAAGGDLRLNTAPGQGTTVSLYLPAVAPDGGSLALGSR